MPTFEALISESASARTIRDIGGGFSSGAFSSGPFDALGNITRAVSGDTLFTNIVAQSSVVDVSFVLDAARSVVVFNSAFTDVISGFDKIFTQTQVNSSVQASAQVSDSPSAIPEYLASVLNSATVSDLIVGLPEYSGRVFDGASGVEVTSATAYFGARVNEVAIPIDVIFTNFTVNAAVAELIQGVDRPFAQTTVFSFLASSASYSDMVMARLQWEPINTNASAVVDWKLINTSI